MAGIPLFSGFIAKEQFYESVTRLGASRRLDVASSSRSPWRRACASGAAGLIAGIAPFRGRSMPTPASHDAPASLWLGPVILGAVGCRSGRSPGAGCRPYRSGGGGRDWDGTAGHVRALAWLQHHARAQRVDARRVGRAVRVAALGSGGSPGRRALHAERLYSTPLAALDAISRRIAPALQSASLRSYVLIGRSTAIALVATCACDRACPSAAAALDARRVPRRRCSRR